MKKRILLLAFTLLNYSTCLLAQDTLVTVTGDELSVKLLEVKPGKVFYELNVQEKIVPDSIDIKQIFMIKYGSGAKDVFSENIAAHNQEAEEASETPYSTEELYLKGKEHAQDYYNTDGITILTAVATILTPVAGVLAYAVSFHKPKQYKIETPEPALATQQAYTKGYTDEIIKKRKRAAGKGLIIGLTAYACLILAIIEE